MSVAYDFTALTGDAKSRWNYGAPLGTPVTVTYNFPDEYGLPWLFFDNPFSAERYYSFTAAQAENFRAATKYYEAIAGITFVEVNGEAMINVFNAEGSTVRGWANFANANLAEAEKGNLVIDGKGDYSADTEEFGTILHELGHALGLKHPHEGEIRLSPWLDFTDYTIMSYQGSLFGPDLNQLGPLDLDAMQYFYGLPGNDFTARYDDAQNAVILQGDEADNILLGVSKRSIIDGGDGNDRLYGRKYNDILLGGAGDDSLWGSGGNDRLDGGSGNDILKGGGGDDRMKGGAGNDRLSGQGNDDILKGNGGADTLKGGGGHDRLAGGGGRDVLDGQRGNDVLFGGGGSDYLSGSAGNDRLLGQNGKDELFGDFGNDVLIGGRGNDRLTGGAGKDSFIFTRGDGFDTITDFEQNRDVIEIRQGANGFDALHFLQVNDSVLIRFANVRIMVEHQYVDDFDASDFLF